MTRQRDGTHKVKEQCGEKDHILALIARALYTDFLGKICIILNIIVVCTSPDHLH